MEEIRKQMRKTWVKKSDTDVGNGFALETGVGNSSENLFKASSLRRVFKKIPFSPASSWADIW